MKLIASNQFDTIYHEHFSYLSLIAVDRIFSANGLTVFDVEELPTHGGSLRVFAQRSDAGTQTKSRSVGLMLGAEADAGMMGQEYYEDFQVKADRVKNDFLRFLLQARAEGKSAAAYGAAAKGNTLINYAGVRSDLISFVVDRNPFKQNKYMPGSRIPIVEEGLLKRCRPDYVIILPWNLKAEIVDQLAYIRDWSGQFVTAVPKLKIL